MASKIWNNIFNEAFKNIPKNNHNDYDYDYHIDNQIDRINYNNQLIYSIDPEGCTDADDAFSIYKENDNIHLLIHIADPTSYFNPNDSLFNDIINNGTTIYLSNREPDHLFPNNILEKCSLTHGIRNVIIVHTIINNNVVISSNIEYGIINCSNGKRFSYENVIMDDIILLGLQISEQFKNARVGTLNDLSLTIPLIISNEVILKPDSKETRMMKNMIAEFAIHANTVFARELDINNLFIRKLELNKDNNYNNIHDLIKDGISANYTTENKKHELIGTNQIYTHSTSPLRRASDCIVHFLLKARHLNIECPFTHKQLELFAEKLNKKNKEMKQIQFKDIKLRTFQWIAEELECRLNPIKIKVKSINYKAPFINLMIIKIDNMDVNIPYTLRRKKNSNIDMTINITKINPYDKYDEGTLPELDSIIKP